MRISRLTCVAPSPRTVAPLTPPVVHFPCPSCWVKRGRQWKPGHLRAGAARRQLLSALGRAPHAVPAGAPGARKGTRTGAATSHPAAHPRGGAEEQRPVPCSCLGARGETLPAALTAKTAQTWACEGVRGDRGRPLGSAKPARTRPSGPARLAQRGRQSVSRVWQPVSLRAEHDRGRMLCGPFGTRDCPRFPCRFQETSRGKLCISGKR